MVSGNPNTLGSFGELPEEHDPNRCKFYIEFSTTLKPIPGLEWMDLYPIGSDDNDNIVYGFIITNGTTYLDDEEPEYDRIMKCLRDAGDAVSINANEFESWYEEPEWDD